MGTLARDGLKAENSMPLSNLPSTECFFIDSSSKLQSKKFA